VESSSSPPAPHGNCPAPGGSQQISQLTEQEPEVLACLGVGLSDAQIGDIEADLTTRLFDH